MKPHTVTVVFPLPAEESRSTDNATAPYVGSSWPNRTAQLTGAAIGIEIRPRTLPQQPARTWEQGKLQGPESQHVERARKVAGPGAAASASLLTEASVTATAGSAAGRFFPGIS